MAKTFAGILAVSITALLFAGCGGSDMTPAQKERCEELGRRIRSAPANATEFKKHSYDPTRPNYLEEYRKEFAALGC